MKKLLIALMLLLSTISFSTVMSADDKRIDKDGYTYKTILLKKIRNFENSNTYKEAKIPKNKDSFIKTYKFNNSTVEVFKNDNSVFVSKDDGFYESLVGSYGDITKEEINVNGNIITYYYFHK